MFFFIVAFSLFDYWEDPENGAGENDNFWGKSDYQYSEEDCSEWSGTICRNDNRVTDRLGIDMDQQMRYKVFDWIYEEGMQEKKGKRNKNRR